MKAQKLIYTLLSCTFLVSSQIAFASDGEKEKEESEVHGSTASEGEKEKEKSEVQDSSLGSVDTISLPDLDQYSTPAGKRAYIMLRHMKNWQKKDDKDLLFEGEVLLIQALKRHNLLPEDPFFSQDNLKFQDLLLRIAKTVKAKDFSRYLTIIGLKSGENNEKVLSDLEGRILTLVEDRKITEKSFTNEDLKKLITLFSGLTYNDLNKLTEKFKLL